MGTKNLLILFFLLVTGNVLMAQSPVISGFGPTSGTVSTTVFITGTNLNATSGVTIGGKPATVLSASATNITAIVPVGAITGKITVNSPDGTATSATDFTLKTPKLPKEQQYFFYKTTVSQAPAVAINADGSTALIGNPDNNGEVLVYSRKAALWTQQGNPLQIFTPDGSFENFGNSVALSADGNIAVIGAPNDDQQKGAAWIFIRTNGVWALAQPKLVGTGGHISNSNQGRSVAISADGNTIISGGVNADSKNAAWIFTKTGTQWQQSAIVVAPEGGAYGRSGQPVALSSDGNTIAIGGIPGVYVFFKDNGNWVQQGGKLYGNDETKPTGPTMGSAVSLSADGNTLAMGAPGNNEDQGAAWIFARNAGTWTQEGPNYNPSYNELYLFGFSVNLSTDGSSMAIGTPAGNSNTGGVLFFKRGTRAGWDSTAGIVNPNEENGYADYGHAMQGSSVAVSADGKILIESGIERSAANYWMFADNSISRDTLTIKPIPTVTYGYKALITPEATITGSNIYDSITFSVPNANNAVARITNNKIRIFAAGTTTVTATQTSNWNNYQPAKSVSTKLVVNKAELYIKPDSVIRIVGTANPAFKVKYTGLVNKADSTNIPVNVIVTTTATVSSPVGTYPLTASTNTVPQNYNLNFQQGTLTIVSAPLTFNTPANAVYGAADFSPVATSLNTIKPIIFTSSNPSVATIVNNKIHIIAPGIAQITASQATDGYYPAYSITQSLTIDKAQLTITANNQSMFVGDAFPLLTIKYSGFVNGDDSTALITLARIATTATSASQAGTYPIVVSGATSRNYVFTYINGQFTVTNAIPTITSFSPATAIAGTTVTITGTHLDKVTAVKFGNTGAASFTAASKTTLTAVVASGSSGNVSVTAPGGTVSLTGFTFMYTLPTSNFVLTTTGATCNGSDNGSLKITAAQAVNYTATITGNGLNTPYTFTTTKTITNLAPGTYNICITVAGQPDYKQCYDAIITEPKDLSVYAEVNPNQDQLSLALGGGVNYTIKLNGVQYNTTESSINLPLSLGDNEVEVTTDKLCQGIFKKIFSIGQRIIPYPNPFQSALKLNLGNKNIGSVAVEIHDLADGRLVYLKQYANQSGILSLDLGELKNHVYSLKLTRDSKETVYKIIKQQ